MVNPICLDSNDYESDGYDSSVSCPSATSSRDTSYGSSPQAITLEQVLMVNPGDGENADRTMYTENNANALDPRAEAATEAEL